MLVLKTEAFPGINGEIQINCYKDNETLEFIIEPNGDVSFVLEDETREILSREKLSIEEALNFLKGYGKKIWNLSDRSIQITTTSTEEDLLAWRSKIPPMEAEYRLFPALV